ncbi:hypothetical protein BKA56DRAFT_626315 [Ilyonectria sp. MPI-CAGE-AT-0026]|nr:hypothetical protein BKA56DRAFT_626315 [Ilyonectria sp. MPI-CAGE-AT-0026]
MGRPRRGRVPLHAAINDFIQSRSELDATDRTVQAGRGGPGEDLMTLEYTYVLCDTEIYVGELLTVVPWSKPLRPSKSSLTLRGKQPISIRKDIVKEGPWVRIASTQETHLVLNLQSFASDCEFVREVLDGVPIRPFSPLRRKTGVTDSKSREISEKECHKTLACARRFLLHYVLFSLHKGLGWSGAGAGGSMQAGLDAHQQYC